MMSLWIYFWIAFALGFITIWLGVPDDIETSSFLKAKKSCNKRAGTGYERGFNDG